MTGLEYEKFCVKYLIGKGFSDVQNTQASGDQGVDIVAYKDGVKWAFQCKYYDSSVGNKAIQEAFSGSKYYDCEKSVVITNSTFTKSAFELAQKLGVALWEDIYPYSPSIEMDLDSIENDIEDELVDDIEQAEIERVVKPRFHKKYYYNFSFRQHILVKEDVLQDAKYYKHTTCFKKIVNDFENSLALYKPLNFNRNQEKQQREYLNKCIDELFQREGLDKVFLIDWKCRREFIFRYSNLNKAPINVNHIKQIEHHFNTCSKTYCMNAFFEDDEEVFGVRIFPKSSGITHSYSYSNYSKFLDLCKIERYHNNPNIIHLEEDSYNCNRFFNSFIWELGLYIYYDIKFKCANKGSLPIDIDYLNDTVFLYDAIVYEETGMIYMRFLCELNNRAKYDKRYKDIIKTNDCLLISLRMNVVDYYLKWDKIEIRDYPDLIYSYVNSKPFKDEQRRLLLRITDINNQKFDYLHDQNFIYSKY